MRMLLLGLLAAALAAGCSKPAETNEGRKDRGPVAVRTARVERRDISEILRFTGEIESPLSVQVVPKVPGRLEALALASGAEATEGVEVKQGEVLARIDSRDWAAHVALAEAQMRQAEVTAADRERERGRLEALFTDEVATEQARDAAVTAHDSAQAALAQARAQLELAKVNLDETVLRAPMDGVVAARHVDPGAMVGPGTPIVQIAQMDPLRLMVAVPARLLPLLEAGRTWIEVESDVYPGKTFSATVNRIFPAVDPATRTLRVEVLLENPKEHGGWRFRPGMYATAQLTLATSPGALTVPATAVVRVLGRKLVFVVRDGRVVAAEVRTGIRSGADIEIAEGLSEGDEFVVMGQNKLTDGAAIERVAAVDEAAE
jgi:RND family efflux transporter MFP subunit